MVGGEVDPTNGGVTTVSSIALLQERFRQLQKMKELRQEQQLLKILSESERNVRNIIIPPFTHYSQPKLQSNARYLGTEVIVFLPPKPQLSLSLWPDTDSQTKNSTNSNVISKSWFNRDQRQKPWFCDSRMMMFENPSSEVDTSLRL